MVNSLSSKNGKMEIGQKPINRTMENQITPIQIIEYCSEIKGNILDACSNFKETQRHYAEFKKL